MVFCMASFSPADSGSEGSVGSRYTVLNRVGVLCAFGSCSRTSSVYSCAKCMTLMFKCNNSACEHVVMCSGTSL